ncbi:MAG TPA: acyl-CoA dehydrogenase family protein [Elusimicrobiota bacterium]|jgi:alkylation response protein AidB-like acyl-CoA dehydrogenase|nr:acyl-CoA dehydrogenase family protein [Elusimicrobiota bacterium]
MDFQFSESMTMLGDAARQFADKRLKPGAQEWDEKEAIPEAVYNEAAELGFFGLSVPEAFGGLGVDPLAYAVAMEELARGSAALQVCVTVHNSLVCAAIAKHGTDEQKRKYLPKMAAGEWIGAYSLSEPGSGTDAGSLSTAAVDAGDHYVVSGTKSWVTSGGFASVYLVFVSTNKEAGSRGITCLLVDKGTPGFTAGKKEKKMGLRASDTRELVFQNAKIPKTQVLGHPGGGFKIAMSQLDSGRIGIAAQAVGIAQAALEEAVSYAKQRKQFGKKLAEFQLTQAKLSDMATNIEAARLLVYRAADLLARGEKCTKEASMAKSFASRMANKACYDAVQIHGGNGYVREFPVERYFRDVRVTEIYEGTTEVQSLIVAREVLG